MAATVVVAVVATVGVDTVEVDMVVVVDTVEEAATQLFPLSATTVLQLLRSLNGQPLKQLLQSPVRRARRDPQQPTPCGMRPRKHLLRHREPSTPRQTSSARRLI